MTGTPLEADYRKLLGQNLRDWRKARGLSQEDLAFAAGIDRTYVSGIERGRRNPSLLMIARLAEALGVTPGDLLAPRGREAS